MRTIWIAVTLLLLKKIAAQNISAAACKACCFGLSQEESLNQQNCTGRVTSPLQLGCLNEDGNESICEADQSCVVGIAFRHGRIAEFNEKYFICSSVGDYTRVLNGNVSTTSPISYPTTNPTANPKDSPETNPTANPTNSPEANSATNPTFSPGAVAAAPPKPPTPLTAPTLPEPNNNKAGPSTTDIIVFSVGGTIGAVAVLFVTRVIYMKIKPPNQNLAIPNDERKLSRTWKRLSGRNAWLMENLPNSLRLSSNFNEENKPDMLDYDIDTDL